MKTELRDIFFDLDDTLWDFKKNSALVYRDILRRRELAVDPEQFQKIYRPINDAYWTQYQNGEIGKNSLRFNRLFDTFKALNFEVSSEEIWEISEEFNFHLPDYNYLIAGAKEVLEILRRHFSLHVLTNGWESVQRKKMERAGLSPFFKTFTASDEAGAKKPDARIFERALEKSGAKKESSLMIGDNLEADIRGAEDFGIRAIYFSPNEAEEDYQGEKILHLLELKELIV